MSRSLIALVVSATLAAAAAHAETPLERGTYLMNSIVACGNCHTPQTPNGPDQSMELAGQKVIEDKMMTAYAPNITQHKEDGIGAWTDEQIIKAIRDGIRPDGSLIGPPMPFSQYRNMSDSDVRAIVAYLRTVKPVKGKQPKSEFRIPLPPAWGPPVASVADVSREDKIEYGKYLTGPLGHCVECHTPMTADGRFDFENRMFAGGFELPGPWGIAVSANITPHPDGIGDYTDDQIKTAITTGLKPDGARLSPPMGYAYYQNIKTEDLDAIVAYLRSVPPKRSAD